MTQSTDEFVSTDQVVSNIELRAIVGQWVFPEEEAIQTCAGEWRRVDFKSWRFWKDPDFEDS